jgi:hypothetical protein
MFDEMKIKEGLIWSQHNNKLLGFTHIECMQDRVYNAVNICLKEGLENLEDFKS